MHLTGNAAFWAQSLEFSIRDLAWNDFCKLISDRFERDQHNQLLRQFFHIRQLDSVADYIEKFDSLVHQILAHDPKFNAATITHRFIDGLRDDIRAVVLVQRPGNLDTASSIAFLLHYCRKKLPERAQKESSERVKPALVSDIQAGQALFLSATLTVLRILPRILRVPLIRQGRELRVVGVFSLKIKWLLL